MKKLLPLFVLVLLLAACTGTESATSPTDEPAGDESAASTDTPTEEETSEVVDNGDEETTISTTDGLDIDLFFDGALAEEPTVVNCTLSDGTETSCYEITIAGYPADYEVGPFCPETTETLAEDAGIWFDGNGVYDVDGEFILGLAELYGDDNWKLYNDDGSVNITDTAEEFELAARPDVDPSLYNHCVAGKMEWLENGEPVQTTVTIPVTPVLAGSASAGGNWGVTLNGVIIAAQAPVDAILSAYTIAVFDDCGGHINPFDGYHLHGAVGCSEVGEASEGETPIFAYALDGYPIHSALDTESDAGAEVEADLDECNGHTTEEFGYHYHANPAEENSVISCFMGLTVGGGQGGEGGGEGGRPEGGQPGGAPDFAAAAEALGIDEQELMDALGGPPPDLEAAAETLDITLDELQEALNLTDPE